MLYFKVSAVVRLFYFWAKFFSNVQLHRNTGIERDFGVWRFGKV